MSETHWHGTGESQLIDGENLAAIDERLERALGAATRTGSHLWTAFVIFRVDPALVLAGGSPMLDSETMLNSPAVGCYVCERPFEPALLHRRCRGVPKR